MTPCSTCKHRSRPYGYSYYCRKQETKRTTYSGTSGHETETIRVFLDDARYKCKGKDHEPTFWAALKTWLKELRKG